MILVQAMRDNQKQPFTMEQSYRAVPMRLFATWEMDRTSSNCVPRLCTMSLNRLTVFKALEPDMNCLVIAVKLQGYKRTLRSNDFPVQLVNGTIDVDLDISFTLQYPHFVKKRNNCLLVMLQRRKRYKGRSIPGGFKTLALGMINLTEVLQSTSTVKDIALYSDLTDVELSDVISPTSSQVYPRQKTQATAKLYLHVLSSQPLEQDDSKVKDAHNEFTDEEDDDSTANEDGAGGSDSEPSPGMPFDEGPATARSRTISPPSSGAAKRSVTRQKNLKQKIVALLKKFKISEEDVLKAVDNPHSQQPTEQEIRDLFEELDNYSNSDQEPDADAMSIKSTPKPSLRPYFGSLTSSREVLPVTEKSAKDSEDSKESGGDSQGDLDTTDPDISEALASIANGEHQGSAAASAVTAPSVISKDTAASRKRREPLRTAVTLPGAHAVEKRKGVFPSNRQVSADVLPASMASSTDAKSVTATGRQQSLNERSSVTVGKLRGLGKANETVASTMPSLAPLVHKPINEQLAQILPLADDSNNVIPDVMLILSAFDVQCQNIVDRLREKVTAKLVVVSTQPDTKAVFNTLVGRIQKYCNTNTFQPQHAVKLVLMGGDRFFAYCLKSFTEVFAQKSNEWLHYVRVFVLGSSWSVVSRFLSTIDRTYSVMFNDGFWREWWDKAELSSQETTDVIGRVSRYVQGAKLTFPLPIAEAMLQLKEKGTGDEMTHIFVPFVVELRRAAGESASTDDSFPQSPMSTVQFAAGAVQSSSSCSPPNSATYLSSPRGVPTVASDACSATAHCSPPGSPHFLERSSVFGANIGEAQDLQVEYWTPAGAAVLSQPSAGPIAKKDASSSVATSPPGTSGSGTPPAQGGSIVPTKYSLKTAFKSLVITRCPAGFSTLVAEAPSSPPLLMVQFVKERKKDKMLQKLGMKNKEKIESEQKCQSIDGISRLICSAKQHATMKLNIDGVEWTNVKFFQVSSQWQTHVKVIPIALFHIDS